ncbi:hypothetical protein [Rubrobacter indicoceani]|nr:hypothetical protein [Rubrobacter indicoceani]
MDLIPRNNAGAREFRCFAANGYTNTAAQPVGGEAEVTSGTL